MPWSLIDYNANSIQKEGRSGGLVVIVLAWYSNELSSTPAEAYSFYLLNII